MAEMFSLEQLNKFKKKRYEDDELFELDLDGEIYGQVSMNHPDTGLPLREVLNIRADGHNKHENLINENAVLLVEALNTIPDLLEKIEELQDENQKTSNESDAYGIAFIYMAHVLQTYPFDWEVIPEAYESELPIIHEIIDSWSKKFFDIANNDYLYLETIKKRGGR